MILRATDLASASNSASASAYVAQDQHNITQAASDGAASVSSTTAAAAGRKL
jgi:hypothetical protein